MSLTNREREENERISKKCHLYDDKAYITCVFVCKFLLSISFHAVSNLIFDIFRNWNVIGLLNIIEIMKI